MIWVADVTVSEAAAAEPKFTAVAPVNPVPVTVTEVPPAAGPPDGLTAVTDGTGAYVKRSPAAVGEVPPGVVTVRSTRPAAPAGAVAVICVVDSTVYELAGVEPNVTAVVPPKPVPVIVTTVPPATGPVDGLTPETVGIGKYV
jgi:hypothetical protein